MLYSEFKELMGLKEVSEETYTQADKIYLACDLSKKVFCDLYKHCSAEAILLLDNIVDILKKSRTYQRELSTKLDILKTNAELLLERYNSVLELSEKVPEDYAGAFEEDARMFFDIASEMLGHHEAVLTCLRKGYPLLVGRKRIDYKRNDE